MIEESVNPHTLQGAGINLLFLMRHGNMFAYKEMREWLIKKNLLSENKKDDLKFKIIISQLKKEGLIDKRNVDGRYYITPKGKILLEKLRG
ncbi:MAG: hypothetical protein AAB366_00775 [Patescibacteria group bacterium]|mgnify:CR=1 FL=1